VLITVLWALVILTVLTVGFGHRALIDQRAAAYSADYTEAYYRARGAAEYGAAYIRNETYRQSLLASAGIIEPFNMKGESDLLAGKGVYSVSDPELYKDDKAGYSLEDEESRISLNTVPEKVLDNIEGLSFTTVEAILSRRKSGDNAEPQPFTTIEEVRLLEGMKDDLWDGTKDRPGLRGLFTIYGNGKINVNTASREVLAAIPDLDEAVLDGIIAFRLGPDGQLGTNDDRSFRTLPDMAQKLSLTAEAFAPIGKYCRFDSEVYTITGFSTDRQGKVRASVRTVVKISRAGMEFLNWSEGDFGS
jgi:hypothetical protein